MTAHGQFVDSTDLDIAVCEDRPLHVVCAPRGDYLALITTYIPCVEEWENYKKRKKT